jgi:hypothetical protein
MSIWSMLRGTGEAREKVQPAGPPSFEVLEPRLLLDGNLADLLPPVMCGEPAPQDAIHVDLGRQNVESQTDPGSVLTIDLASGDEMGQPAPAPMASETLPPETHGPSEEAKGQQVLELFGLSPALFVENQGQWSDPAVRYVHDGTGFDVAMTDTGVQFQGPAPDGHLLQFLASFAGAKVVRPVGLERSGSLFNYHVGDQANWRQNVPAYAAVVYEGLYQGIDLRVQGLRSHLKYEFHVAPGADYGQIAIRYEGIGGLSIGADGALEVNLGAERGVIRDDAPYIYQEIDGRKVEVAGRFVLLNEQTYSFAITGAMDPRRELIIDPDLAWSIYLGGPGSDYAEGIALGTAGDVYVMGHTDSAGWVSGGFDASLNGSDDLFVVKLSSTGTHLWSTYVGGAGDEWGANIAVDSTGAAYVYGDTEDAGPPWISGGYDTSYGGSGDAFVVKLSASGGHVWSTYLGGTGYEYATGGLAVDGPGNLYVVGGTGSSDWVSGGFDTTYNGNGDGFLVKLSGSGAHLWSTYLGGAGSDEASGGIATDAASNLYVSGGTESTGWISGGFDTIYNGNGDGFVMKLTGAGVPVWSTYVGGDAADDSGEIVAGTEGSIYLTGDTESAGWVSGGFDTTYNGAGDAFVVKLGGAGSHVWSTYLGGTSSDNHGGLAVDSTGNVYAAGGTTSANWVSGGFDTTYNGGPDDGDAFVLKLTDTGAHVWSTYLGGAGSDEAHGIAVDGSYGVYVACDTNSADLAGGGFDATYNGDQDGFVVKITDSASPSPVYRFWSDKFHGHFYTISAQERDHVIATWPEDWTYEGPAYNAFAPGRQPAGTIPIYRFWSGTFQGHFYTASPSERDHVIATWPQDWTYEGVAYYAYANEQHPTGTLPVYRFWSPTFRHHFYTISLTERDTVIAQWPEDWTYEGEAWYAYAT